MKWTNQNKLLTKLSLGDLAKKYKVNATITIDELSGDSIGISVCATYTMDKNQVQPVVEEFRRRVREGDY